MSNNNFIMLVCDRKEGDVAVLLSDGGEETRVLSPISLSLVEGGVYRCSFADGVLLSAERDEAEEARRREASASLLAKLFKNK